LGKEPWHTVSSRHRTTEEAKMTPMEIQANLIGAVALNKVKKTVYSYRFVGSRGKRIAFLGENLKSRSTLASERTV
jgi:hypothetical protein